MNFIIKLSPEITIKSPSFRWHLIKILTSNIRNIFKNYENNVLSVTINKRWDHIQLKTKNKTKKNIVHEILTRIPGIHHILEVKEILFTSLHEVLSKVLEEYNAQIEGKTFCVRVKRRGKHSFSSVEAEHYLGSALHQYVKSSRIKLVKPDVTINIVINENRCFLVKNKYKGIGGLPVGTQGNVLSLISGGFDSSISSYMLICRGCRVHYCFFNLGDLLHEANVRQVAYYLWSQYSGSHRVRFFTVDFKPVLEEILKKVDNRQVSIILKRMMFRVASKIAKRYNMNTIITGEVIGQVSSQTLNNLQLIDSVIDLLILRPLISYDKEAIISLAKKIGTEKFSRIIPEYCGVISKHPTAKAEKSKIEEEECKFNFSILDRTIEKIDYFNVNQDIDFKKIKIEKLEIVNYCTENDVILDIRSIEEQYNFPFKIKGVKVVSLPFYKLSSQFCNLDQNKNWLLWCNHGIMSRLQAIYLIEQGFTNVKVYRPS